MNRAGRTGEGRANRWNDRRQTRGGRKQLAVHAVPIIELIERYGAGVRSSGQSETRRPLGQPWVGHNKGGCRSVELRYRRRGKIARVRPDPTFARPVIRGV